MSECGQSQGEKMDFNSSDVSICRKWSCLTDWTQSEILLTMKSAEYVLELEV